MAAYCFTTAQPVPAARGKDRLMPERIVWDVFISHASEDKDDFVRPLARGLGDRGLNVWFDEYTLTVGDSLRRSIDRGLAGSRFGIVVISPDFLHKEWPQRELDGLVAREIGGGKVILPVWHNISAEQIRQYSPTLADRLAVSSARGLDHVIAELMRVIEQADATGGATRAAAQRPPVDFGTSFEKLPVGSLFRFYQRDETAFGLKAIFNYGSGDTAALVLTPAAGLRPGDLLPAHEIRDVVQLKRESCSIDQC
jgi:hypothetical protein